MQWPTLIVDNFFTDPHAVVEFSKTLKFTKDSKLRWPGTRSPSIDEVNRNFFVWSTKKIMALLYPNDIFNEGKVTWKAVQHFQRIPTGTYGKEGWIHVDGSEVEISALIYLTDFPRSGTSIYKGKHLNPDGRCKYLNEKELFLKNLKDKKRYKKYRDKANSFFQKEVEVFSSFNRLAMFDANHWHASKHADDGTRLTLVTFFTDISGDGLRYPITQMRRM